MSLNNTLHSPLAIRVMLHHLCIHEPFQPQSDASRDVETYLCNEGLLVPDADEPGIYNATAKGTAWVEGICDLPLPRQIWVIDYPPNHHQ